jgi:hypothetical protein
MERFTASLENAQISLEEMLRYFAHENVDTTLVDQIAETMENISKALLSIREYREQDVEDFNRFLTGKRKMRNMRSGR